MVSAVRDYIEIYDEFKSLYEEKSEILDPILDLNSEIRTLEESKEKSDYKDINVVTSCMEQYIQSETQRNEYEIAQSVAEEAEPYNNPSKQAVDGFNYACSIYGREKANDLIKNCKVNFNIPVNPQNAENTTWLKLLKNFDTFNFFVFRLGIWPNITPFIRIPIGVVIWTIILSIISEIVRNVSNHTHIFPSLIVGIILIAGNIAGAVVLKSVVHSYILKNLAVFKAITDFNSLKDEMYQNKLSEFQNNVVAKWNRELESIRNNGLPSDVRDPDSVYLIVKNNLENEYNNYCNLISDKKNQIKKLEKDGMAAGKKFEELKPQLEEKAKRIEVMPVSYENQGVITPYAAIGFSVYEDGGVKKLINIKHDCKPVVIEYEKPSIEAEDAFRSGVAWLIEKLMNGFLGENYFKNIKMTLVNYDALHFPESRTKGFMNVIHSRNEVTKLMEELNETRDIVNSSGDGRISSISIEKTGKGEEPIKYHIVFFVGYDFGSMEKENIHMFVGGENFGFVPIIFLDKNVIEDSFNESIEEKEFDKIIHRTYNSDNFYSFENIMSEVERG